MSEKPSIRANPDDRVEDFSANRPPSGTSTGNNPAEAAARSSDTLGPILFAIGWIVIAVSFVSGLIAYSMLPDSIPLTFKLGSMMSIWADGVIGVLIIALGHILTYLYRIQAMMGRDRIS